MDTILQEKKKCQVNFRQKIDQYLSKSIFTKQEDQLTPNVLQEIFMSPNLEGLLISNKIQTDKLCDMITKDCGHNAVSLSKDLMKALGNRKQIKVSDLYQLLKSYELHEFDLEEEMEKYFFEDGSFSLKKLDDEMKGFGYNQLTTKDKQILIECFDIDQNKSITRQDFEQVMDQCVNLREKEKRGEKALNKSKKVVNLFLSTQK